MMNTKVKPKNIPPVQAEQPQAKEEKKPEPEPAKKEEPKKEQPKPPKPEPDYSEQIKQLMEMGFEKDKVEASVKAAKGRIDLALEFIENGIPEGLENLDLLEE